jgi:exonuclease III
MWKKLLHFCKLQAAGIHTEIFGSDHCPVELDVDI